MRTEKGKGLAPTAAPNTIEQRQLYHARQSEASKIQLILAEMLFGIMQPNLTRGQRFLAWNRFDQQLKEFVRIRYGV